MIQVAIINFFGRHKSIAIVLVILLASLFTLYGLRGVIRTNWLPWYAKTQNSEKLKQTTLDEYAKLGRPIQTLTGNDPTVAFTCELDIAEQWRTAVRCEYETSNNKPLPIEATANYRTNAEFIEKKLAENNWTPSNTALNIVSTNPATWTHLTNEGRELYAMYSKQVNDINCVISFVSSGRYEYWCSQNHHYFGIPYDHL